MAPKKKITLQDISTKSGFSITTISHVINKTRHVDEKTRKIIQATIAELGYTNNQNNQRKLPDKTIGFVISDVRVDFFTEVARDIADIALENGYNALFYESAEDEKKERQCLEMFMKNNVQGVILAPTNCQSKLAVWKDSKIPLVLIDRDLENCNYDFVGIDNFKSAYEATKYLIEYGARSLGYIGFNKSNYTARERQRGFEVALHESGLYHEHCCLTREYKALLDNSDDVYLDFLLHNPKKDAILCTSSNICFELISKAEELEIRIPEDLLIISFDDNKWFDFLKSPVSAIKQPTGDIAVLATELLINKIQNNKPNLNLRQKIILDHTFVNRFNK